MLALHLSLSMLINALPINEVQQKDFSNLGVAVTSGVGCPLGVLVGGATGMAATVGSKVIGQSPEKFQGQLALLHEKEAKLFHGIKESVKGTVNNIEGKLREQDAQRNRNP